MQRVKQILDPSEDDIPDGKHSLDNYVKDPQIEI